MVFFFNDTVATGCFSVSLHPALPVSVQVMVVLPTGKELGALLLIVATPQLYAVGSRPKVTLPNAPLHAPGSLARGSAAGAVMVRVSLSVMVTSCVSVAVFP